MKIVFIGKYPPIEGGVSSQSFWLTHGLAKLGHQVHVVSDARDANTLFRMFMRLEDWQKCSGAYETGFVKLHWSDTEELVSTAMMIENVENVDLIFSYYLEPYGIAGGQVAEALNKPHIVKTAGSDVGRLWFDPRFTNLFDHVFRSAAAILTGRETAQNMAAKNIDETKILTSPGFRLDADRFTPQGPLLDIASLPADAVEGQLVEGRPYLGIYGKIGPAKGTMALLQAVRSVLDHGVDIGLLVMAHGDEGREAEFSRSIEELGLQDHVVWIPFLPHWRVPEFIRSCVAVCCLEQDFPISIHRPVIAREVMTAGGCLIASTELLNKMPQAHKLIDGYNCIAINDVNDIRELSGIIGAAVSEPDRLAATSDRARRYAMGTSGLTDPILIFENILKRATEKQTSPALDQPDLSFEEFVGQISIADPEVIEDIGRLRKLLDKKKAVESAALFRLNIGQLVVSDAEILDLRPTINSKSVVEHFDVDVERLLTAYQDKKLPTTIPLGPSTTIFFEQLITSISEDVAHLLKRCDGTKTMRQFWEEMNQSPECKFSGMKAVVEVLEELFVLNVLKLAESNE